MNRFTPYALVAAVALSACSGYDMPRSQTSGTAMPAAMPTAAPASAHGDMLVDAQGMTLYTFDRDTAGSARSVCNGPCAANWPPLTAPADATAAGPWSLVMRDDGSRQWAYHGKPLYRWAKDKAPGEQSGDGFNGVWHVARP